LRLTSRADSPRVDELGSAQGVAALDGAKTHVLDRMGVRGVDDRVEEPLDRGGSEVAHRHRELSQPVVLAPLLLGCVVVPEVLEHRSGPLDRGAPVSVGGGRLQ
jgi:hypothetical protein